MFVERLNNEFRCILQLSLMIPIDFISQYCKYGKIIEYKGVEIFLTMLLILLFLYILFLILTRPRINISIQSIECPICYDSFHRYYKLKCNHCYCLDCLDKWMDFEDVCPYCRNTIS